MEQLAGSIALSWGLKRAIIAFFAGAIGVLALPPFDFLPIGFISFPILIWLLDGAAGAPDRLWLWRYSAAFMTGWWFGFGYFVAGLWWLANAILIDAPELYWAVPFAVLGLPALLALFFGFAAACARAFWGAGMARLAVLAVSFGLIEILRGFLFTGFPWNSLGMMALAHPLTMQITAWIGVEGVTPLAVFIFSLPALMASARRKISNALLGILLIGLWLGVGFYSLANTAGEGSSPIALRLVQPSVPQGDKWDNAIRDQIFADLLNLSTAQTAAPENPDLIIWPETAVPFLFSERPQALATLASALTGDQRLLAGIVRNEGEGGRERFYNSIVAVDSNGEIVSAADKTHLVPFGEYLPFARILSSIGLKQIVEAAGPFVPGASRGRITLANGSWLYPLICYEVIFSREIKINPEDRPAALINVTNDAWFGISPGPYQHFRHAQLRSVEFGLPTIRVANNGLTGIIDARGFIRDGLALNSIGVVDGFLPTALPPTFYSINGVWSRFVPMTGLLLIALTVTLTTRRRQRSRK